MRLSEVTGRVGKSHGERPQGAPGTTESVRGRCCSSGAVGRRCIWNQGVNLYRCAPVPPRTHAASVASVGRLAPFGVRVLLSIVVLNEVVLRSPSVPVCVLRVS